MASNIEEKFAVGSSGEEVYLVTSCLSISSLSLLSSASVLLHLSCDQGCLQLYTAAGPCMKVGDVFIQMQLTFLSLTSHLLQDIWTYPGQTNQNKPNPRYVRLLKLHSNVWFISMEGPGSVHSAAV